MTILAFDTTHGFCSVAVANPQQKLISKHINETSRQAELLVPTMEAALKEAQLEFSDITTIAATVGPGSFTGLRIGLAAAHGLLLATKASFFGLSALETVAYMAKKSQKILEKKIFIALDARRGEVFLQSFDVKSLSAESEAMLCSYEEAAALLGNETITLAGSGAALISPFVTCKLTVLKESLLPDAKSIAELTLLRLNQGKKGLIPSPLYIRKPDAKLPSKKVI